MSDLKNYGFNSKKRGNKKVSTHKFKASKVKFGDSFTLMVIPNSAKDILNFKLNLVSIIAASSILLFLVFSFFFLNTSLSVSKQELKSTDQNLKETQSNLSMVLDSVSKLGKVYEDYKQSLKEITQKLNIDYDEKNSDILDDFNNSDLSSADYLGKIEGSEYIPQMQEISNLINNLSKTIDPIKEASNAIEKQKQVLADIPNLWPVRGSTTVSMEFGPNEHPIVSKQYIHKGIDIAGVLGMPILASANGKVIQTAYDITDYGINVIVEHKYGFKTRYAHLSSLFVKVGDIVRQGEVIGKMGSTGTSTAPHLHFEVIIGTQIVDPSAYLRLSNEFKRRY